MSNVKKAPHAEKALELDYDGDLALVHSGERRVVTERRGHDVLRRWGRPRAVLPHFEADRVVHLASCVDEAHMVPARQEGVHEPHRT